MPFADNPFSAIQSSPFHQAIGPLTQTMQGPGGSMGQSPFAYMPPPQPMGGVYGGMMPTPAAGLRQNAWQMYGMQSMNPFRPGFYSPSAVHSPAAMIGAGYNMPTQIAGMGAGALHAGLGVGAMAAGIPMAMSAAKGLWAAKSGLGRAISSTVSGAWEAGGTLGTVGHLGMGAGRLMGGLAMAAGPQAIGMALAYGGYKAGQFALGGVSDVRDVHRTMGDSFGGFMGVPGSGFSGRGMGYGASAGVAQSVQASGGQSFRNFSQSFNVFQQLASSGELVRGMRSGTEMKRTLDDAFKTVGELLEVLNTTFEQAGEAFGKIRSMGLGNKRSMVQMALNARVQGGMIGMSVDQMLSLGAEGASAARGMGMYGAGGASALMGAATGFGTAFQSGAIDARLMSEITGGTMDPTVAAGAFGRSALAFQKGTGQYMVAGLMGAGGKIDSAALQNLLSGKTSVQDIVSRGTSNLASPGALNKFLANKQRLTSDLFEKAGDDSLSLYYQMAKYSADMTPGGATDEMMQLFLMQNMGLDESMAAAAIKGGGPEQTLFRNRRKSESRRQAEAEAMRRKRSIGGRLESGLYAPVRSFGAGIAGGVAGIAGNVGMVMDDFYADVYGERRPSSQGEWLTSSVREDMLFGGTGGYSAAIGADNRALQSVALGDAAGKYSRGFGNFVGQMLGNKTNFVGGKGSWNVASLRAGESAAGMGAGGGAFGWALSGVSNTLRSDPHRDRFGHVDAALESLAGQGVGDVNKFMVNNLTKTGDGTKVLDQVAKDLRIVVKANETSAQALLRAANASEYTARDISRSLASSGLGTAGALAGDGSITMQGSSNFLMDMAAGGGGATYGESVDRMLRRRALGAVGAKTHDAFGKPIPGSVGLWQAAKDMFNISGSNIDALMSSGSDTAFGMQIRQARAGGLSVEQAAQSMLDSISGGNVGLSDQIRGLGTGFDEPTKLLHDIVSGGGGGRSDILKGILGKKLSSVSASPREMAKATEGIRNVLQGVLESQGATAEQFFGKGAAGTMFGKSLSGHVPILDPTNTYVDATLMYGDAIDKLMAGGVKEGEVGALASLGVTSQGVARARDRFGQITSKAKDLRAQGKDPSAYITEQASLIRGRLGIDSSRQGELEKYLSGSGKLSGDLDQLMIKKLAQSGELEAGMAVVDEGQAMFNRSVQTFQEAVKMFAEAAGVPTETYLSPGGVPTAQGGSDPDVPLYMRAAEGSSAKQAPSTNSLWNGGF